MLVTIQFTLGILSWSQLIAQAVKDTRDKHQRANFATYIYTTTIHHIDMANARFPQLIEQLEANIFKALDDRVLCLTLTTPRRFMPIVKDPSCLRNWHSTLEGPNYFGMENSTLERRMHIETAECWLVWVWLVTMRCLICQTLGCPYPQHSFP